MGEIDVVADGEHRYRAALVTADGARSEHVVTSDSELLERVRATEAEEPFLVRRVLEVLLEASENSGNPVPPVVDLRQLDRERPELLPSVPLR
ncbi:hypothetical protein [Kineococcus rhizosphaerae]|uniref:Uncharacterized protein n=1 Tax=Kineococcus rhizosphaerae TaxID=559628 RepID=A0A2T0R5D4_9ACTN|nr:hypothetical protein [Kineococcus rhizosphaerae]PRY15954.1 hypothetical protein CLV37_104167 [Kineococcus rhizosphaerae]